MIQNINFIKFLIISNKLLSDFYLLRTNSESISITCFTISLKPNKTKYFTLRNTVKSVYNSLGYNENSLLTNAFGDTDLTNKRV